MGKKNVYVREVPKSLYAKVINVLVEATQNISLPGFNGFGVNEVVEIAEGTYETHLYIPNYAEVVLAKIDKIIASHTKCVHSHCLTCTCSHSEP